MHWVENLCQWYDTNHRRLPWRETNDAYRIWISEIMLQQTQVITVIDYYHRFIAKFPTVAALAEADEHLVMKLWEGLGYYSRARNLHRCAKAIVEQHDGVFPNTYEALLKLPGIGPYTAGAIASIAFNQKVPAVDGNVQRVLSRYFRLDYDLSSSKATMQFQTFLAPFVPKRAGTFTQAMMELGATVCTPKAPSCECCPISTGCEANRIGDVLSFPIKTKKLKKQTLQVRMAVVNASGETLFFKQTAKRLLNGLWTLPFEADSTSFEAFRSELASDFNLKLDEGILCGQVKHVFTHLVWEIEVYVFNADVKAHVDYPEMRWVTLNASGLEGLALPTVVLKVLKCYENTLNK